MIHRLIVLVGTTPAVVTETVYALWEKNDVPNEVIAITTEVGRAAIKSQLLDSGLWKQMLDDIGLCGKIKFGDNSRNIKCIPNSDRDSNSRDIITGEDNLEMANYFLSELRSHTEEPGVKISFSISGGRKTMSAVGALVMSLLAHRDDRLFHILVKPPFDDPTLTPRFYYPVKGMEYRWKGKTFRAEDADMQLSEIPFVRCRYWFQEKQIAIPNYANLVESINRSHFDIHVNVASKNITINDTVIKLPYLQFLLYWMFAEQRLKGDSGYLIGDKNDLLEKFKLFLDDKNILIGRGNLGRGRISSNAVFDNQLDEEYLNKRITDMRNKIVEAFNYQLTEDEEQKLGLRHGDHKFGISPNISRSCIKIEE